MTYDTLGKTVPHREPNILGHHPDSGCAGAGVYLFLQLLCGLFPEYTEEQFLMMYGMLTGTASTGGILLREIDGSFRTPAADNMVYQNFPAIVFGFPLMLLANLAPCSRF